MPGVRIDSGVTEGDEVSVHYDPLIAKLIASAGTREGARRRALAALREFPLLGVHTNAPFLIALLEHPRFVSGEIDTGLVDAERDALVARGLGTTPLEAVAVAVHASTAGRPAVDDAPAVGSDPWDSLRSWRG